MPGSASCWRSPSRSPGISSAVMAHLANRVGARRMLWIALLAWSGLLVLMSAVQQKWAFVGSLVLVEIAGGSIDTAMNAEATHRFNGRPSALLRFHALFNCGAIAGAAAAGIVLHAGVSWRWIWPGVAVVALAVGLWTLSLGPEPAPDASSASAHVAPMCTRSGASGATGSFSCWPSSPWPRSPREGSTPGASSTCATTWPRASSSARAPTSSVRWWPPRHVRPGSTVVGRLSIRHALFVGGCIAGGGILLESLSPSRAWLRFGLALGAGGASLFWPLVMSKVSRLASQVVSAVGTFTAAGYIGWVAGAPIVGWVSQAFGPQHGLQVLAVAALAVAAVSLLTR